MVPDRPTPQRLCSDTTTATSPNSSTQHINHTLIHYVQSHSIASHPVRCNSMKQSPARGSSTLLPVLHNPNRWYSRGGTPHTVSPPQKQRQQESPQPQAKHHPLCQTHRLIRFPRLTQCNPRDDQYIESHRRLGQH